MKLLGCVWAFKIVVAKALSFWNKYDLFYLCASQAILTPNRSVHFIIGLLCRKRQSKVLGILSFHLFMFGNRSVPCFMIQKKRILYVSVAGDWGLFSAMTWYTCCLHGIYLCVYVLVCTYMCVWKCTCMCVWRCACMCVWRWCTCMCVWRCACVSVWRCACMCVEPRGWCCMPFSLTPWLLESSTNCRLSHSTCTHWLLIRQDQLATESHRASFLISSGLGLRSRL